jgi:two-component system cell cycle response regulator
VSALVLVGDEDHFNLLLLEEVCDAAGYRVATASDGAELLDMVARERPDVVLVDAALPRLDGFEILRILKADKDLLEIPVLVIAAHEDVDGRSRAVSLGAEDCVSKPYRVFELQQRIKNALRAVRGDSAARSTPAVPVPAAATRAELGTSLEYELTRAERYGHPVTLVRLVFDHGAPSAAMSLRVALLDAARACLRASDRVFATGEREIALLLPETDEAGAAIVAARIRARATALPDFHSALGGPEAVRVGFACARGQGVRDPGALLSAAAPSPRAEG